MTTASTTPRRPRANAFGHAIFAETLLLIALLLLAAAIGITLANSLPGIRPFEDVGQLPLRALVIVPAIIVTITAIELCALRPHSDTVRQNVARAWRLTRFWIRTFTNHLGLIPRNRRHATSLVAVGLAAGLVSFATSVALSTLPALADAPPDARNDAVAQASPWVAPLYFALYAPGWEEVASRGALLLVVAALARWVTHRGAMRVLIVVAVLGSSVYFGLGHLEWSVQNAVSATVGGLIYGAVAVMTRSLWPAIIAHSFYNACVGITWVL